MLQCWLAAHCNLNNTLKFQFLEIHTYSLQYWPAEIAIICKTILYDNHNNGCDNNNDNDSNNRHATSCLI